MLNRNLALTVLGAMLLTTGCATYNRRALHDAPLREMEQAFAHRQPALTPELAERVLALDPASVSARDVREVLTHTPAPRIINIHGGIFPVHRRMISFSEFLVGMGYPRASITNPSDGTYTFSCYESSAKIAGMIAWYYEKEGLRPLMVGHSQGGMQVVKILHHLAGLSGRRLEVWSPLTWRPEGRTNIVDPLTGRTQSVVGLRVPYATATGSGGLTRLLPNQWSLCGRLRSIPGSVGEFTGFYKPFDFLGGDWFGFGEANHSHALGTATVRNVRLPARYNHGRIPDTKHLLQSEAIREWIDQFRPADPPSSGHPEFEGDTENLLWAAEVWYSIKKHWVLELQRYLRARRGFPHAS
ncbi:MAG TPA: hypothetical protein VNO52_03420 [Methylomirabilota bacterium]|nr:hypothetical protein [Methylomirabilota bacterium]